MMTDSEGDSNDVSEGDSEGDSEGVVMRVTARALGEFSSESFFRADYHPSLYAVAWTSEGFYP